MGAMPGGRDKEWQRWEQGVAKRWSQCETPQFCESSASEVMLHFLKQNFTFKEMEGILYKNFSRHTTMGKNKETNCTNYCYRKKRFFC